MPYPSTALLLLGLLVALALPGCANDVGPDTQPNNGGTGDTGDDVSGADATCATAGGATGTAGNRRPSAHVAGRQNADLNRPVTLSGTGSSDVDDDPLTYCWTLTSPQGSTAALADSQGSLATFTPDLAGTYTVSLTVNDGELYSEPANHSINVGVSSATTAAPNFSAPHVGARDRVGKRVLVLDQSLGAVAVLSGAGDNKRSAVDKGVFVTPRDMALDVARNRVLVTDAALRALVAVDLATGHHDVVAGGGAAFGTPAGIAVDAANDRALVTDQGLAALLAVNLATGERRVIAGAGPELRAPFAVAVDSGGSQALITDPGMASVVAVDLASGARAILSGQGNGDGPNFATPLDIVFDGDRALVADIGLDAVLAVDLSSGDRTLVSTSVGLNSLGDLASVHGDAHAALVLVRLSGGEHVIFSR